MAREHFGRQEDRQIFLVLVDRVGFGFYLKYLNNYSKIILNNQSR